MKLPIEIDKSKIEVFCKKWKIIEFSFFGSVLRDDFRPDSDVDVLVVFDPNAKISLFDLMKRIYPKFLGAPWIWLNVQPLNKAETPFEKETYFLQRLPIMPQDNSLLIDILDACQRLKKLQSETSYPEFLHDDTRILAVERLFEIMGEASRNLSEDFREKYGDSPWSKLVGLRNIIIHQYNRIDHSRLWEFISSDIPELIKFLEPITPKNE
jgi:uncharacterized protein with HEPN domain